MSEEEYERMPERIGRHFDRVRAFLDERLDSADDEQPAFGPSRGTHRVGEVGEVPSRVRTPYLSSPAGRDVGRLKIPLAAVRPAIDASRRFDVGGARDRTHEFVFGDSPD